MRTNCLVLQFLVAIGFCCALWNSVYPEVQSARDSFHRKSHGVLSPEYTRVIAAAPVSSVSTVSSNRRVVTCDEPSSPHCGASLLRAFGVRFTVTHDADQSIFLIDVETGNTTDVFLSARGVSARQLAALHVVRAGANAHRVSYSHLDPGRYAIEIDVAWISDRFVGQRWSLPNRNDDPPFAEMKRKCLELTLTGNSCGRYGYPLVRESVHVASTAGLNSLCNWTSSHGQWVAVTQPTDLLDDSVGLNRFNGQVMGWMPAGCSTTIERSAASVLQALKNARVRRIALFGDSMLVEQFYMMHQFLADKSKVTQSKHRRLRAMEFSSAEVHVKFFRSYTTGGGHSIIASPTTVVEQLAGFRPNVVIGNLAVLHWQQNMRTLPDWQANLEAFANAFRAAAALRDVSAHYLGPTLIQMGRTQGLQPQRTAAFARAARRVLSPRFNFVDPFELSVPRRESAFDGQHWACYHRFGGVSHTIMQLILRHVC